MLADWRDSCYSSQDDIGTDLEMNDVKEPVEQYVKIEVRNPRTHISREKALYTDYEILVETNNITFASTESCIRRRYSDFQWLRNRLLSQYGLEKHLPELPPKRLFGRFKRQFLKHRQIGLQRFLEEITKQTAYLSDVTLHLFLQSTLSVKEIDTKLNGTDSGGELTEVLQSPSNSRGRGLSRSSSHVEEHDSGFSYSTTSSLTDGMTTHAPLHKPITNGHYFALPSMDCAKKHLSFNDVQPQQSMPTPVQQQQSPKSQQKFTEAKQQVKVKAKTLPDLGCSNRYLNLPKSDHSIHTDSLHSFYTSSDDELYPHHLNQYDADDETDFVHEKGENNNNYCNMDNERRSDDGDNHTTKSDNEGNDADGDDLLFCFCKDSKGNLYGVDRALEIIKKRPKLTDRLYLQEDSDDCFHESEYDVIDTEDDLDISEVVNDDTYPKATLSMPLVTRSYSYNCEYEYHEDKNKAVDDTTVHYLINSKNKLKTGKVKSLPNIRFPIRNRRYKQHKNVKRSNTYHGIRDLHSRRLLGIVENEEPSQVVDKKPIDNIYLQLPVPRHNASESDCQNFTSDAEYLQTVHKCSEDNHYETNIDTQAEDKPPSKFYNFLRRRKRTKQLHVKLVSFGGKQKDSEVSEEPIGRFSVTPVTKNSSVIRRGSDARINDSAFDDNLNRFPLCLNENPYKNVVSHQKHGNIPIINGKKKILTDSNVYVNIESFQPENTPVPVSHGKLKKHFNKELLGVCKVSTTSEAESHVCVSLCHQDCEFSSSYRNDFEEMYLIEETLPVCQPKEGVALYRSDSLLKTYDVIVM